MSRVSVNKIANLARTKELKVDDVYDVINYDGAPIQDVLDNSKVLSNYTDLRSYGGRATSIRITQSGIAGIFQLDSSDTTSADDGGTVIVSTNGKRWKRLDVTTVTPQIFGAVNSATINSTVAIRQAFAYAALNSKKVSFAGLSKVLIDRSAMIQVTVPVDFANVQLYLADSPGTQCVFQVQEDDGGAMRTVTIASQATLKIGQTRLVFTETLPAGLIYLNSTRQVNSRVLSGVVTPVYFRQVFAIDRDGVLNQPLEDDFTTGSEFTFTFKPYSPTGAIKIENLNLDDKYGQDQQILDIKRSLTICENITIPAGLALSNATITTGVLGFNMMAKGVMRKCYVSSRPSVNVSQYGFTITYCAETVMEDCSGWGLNTWGTILTNYTNGLSMIRCKLQRIDAHECLMNWDLDGCTTIGMPFQYGFGYGSIRVRNHTCIGSDSLLKVRPDYGGDFKGTIDIRGVVWKLRGFTGSLVSIFDAPLGGNLRPVDIAYDVLIEDVLIEYDGATPLLVYGFNVYTNSSLTAAGITSQGFRKPSSVSFKNIRSVGQDIIFTQGQIFSRGLAANNAAKNTDWTFREIQTKGYTDGAFFINNSALTSSYPATSVCGFDKIYIEDCPDIMIQLAKPGVDIFIWDVPKLRGVSTYRGSSSQGELYIKDCIIDGTVAIPSISMGQGEIGSGSSLVALHDTVIKSAVSSLAAVDSLQGVSVLIGITVSWPSGVTATTAFTGWKNTAIFQ